MMMKIRYFKYLAYLKSKYFFLVTLHWIVYITAILLRTYLILVNQKFVTVIHKATLLFTY